jgi:hypothetical protein
MLRPILQVKSGMTHGFFAVPDYEPSMPKDYERYFSPERTSTYPWQGTVSILDPPGSLAMPKLFRLLDLMSVRYYGFQVPVPAQRRRAYRQNFGRDAQVSGQFALIDRPGALPRTYAVRTAVLVPDLDAALSGLNDVSFSPRSDRRRSES